MSAEEDEVFWNKVLEQNQGLLRDQRRSGCQQSGGRINHRGEYCEPLESQHGQGQLTTDRVRDSKLPQGLDKQHKRRPRKRTSRDKRNRRKKQMESEFVKDVGHNHNENSHYDYGNSSIIDAPSCLGIDALNYDDEFHD